MILGHEISGNIQKNSLIYVVVFTTKREGHCQCHLKNRHFCNEVSYMFAASPTLLGRVEALLRILKNFPRMETSDKPNRNYSNNRPQQTTIQQIHRKIIFEDVRGLEVMLSKTKVN